MTPLIDATEMYLRTIWELEEEHIPAIRARLVERLHLSAPAVSETVSRLEAEGLVHMAEDRTLELSETGRELAVSVMRKHRLAELLLTDVIGLDWEHVHAEACRWEHVISDAVEKRLIELLESPTHCPHGNPIPGLGYPPSTEPIMTLHTAAKTGGQVVLRRISEKLQTDIDVMRVLRQDGLGPGVQATVRLSNGHVEAKVEDRIILLTLETARHLYVTAA